MEKVNIIATLMVLQGFLFLHVQSWDFQYSCSYDNGNYNVSWMCNSTSDELYFKVQVKATGWVGFGLADNDGAPNNMQGYDVAVGGVYDNGSCYIKDYLTDGQMKPRLDLQQDWNILNCSEDSGVTTLIFSRAKNTSDENDTAVQEGVPLCIIWAYHDTTDVANDTAEGFPKHTAKGYDCNKTLVPVEDSSSTTLAPSPTSTPTSEGGMTTSTPLGGGGMTTSTPAGGGGMTTSNPAGGGGMTTSNPAGGGGMTTSNPAGGGGETTSTPAGGGGMTTSTPAGGGGETTSTPAGGGGMTTSTPAGGGGITTGVSATTTQATASSSSAVATQTLVTAASACSSPGHNCIFAEIDEDKLRAIRRRITVQK